MTSYYVYYRIEPKGRAELARLVDDMFAAVERESGVQGRRMGRSDDPNTWMEVYERVPDASRFEALLAREAQVRGFERFLEPGTVRHVECFVDLED